MLKKIIIGICVSCLSNMIYDASNNCYATNEPYKVNTVTNQDDQQAQEIATLLSKYFAYTEEQISAKGNADACSGGEQSKALVARLNKSKISQIVGFIVDGPVATEKEKKENTLSVIEKETKENALNTFDKEFIRVFTLGNGLCAIHALGAQLTKESPVLDINRASNRLKDIYYRARLLNAYDIYRGKLVPEGLDYERFHDGLPFFKELLDKITQGGKTPAILDDDERNEMDVMLENLDLIYKKLNDSNDLFEKISNFFKRNESITPEDQSEILRILEELSRLSENVKNNRGCWASLSLEISKIIDSDVPDQRKRDFCNAVVSGINNVSAILDEVDENKMLTSLVALEVPDISATMPVYDDFAQKSNKKLALFWGDANVGDLKISPYAWNMCPLGSGGLVDLNDPTADYVIHEASHFSRVIPRKLFKKVKEKLRNMGIDVYVMNNDGKEIIE